MGYRPSDGFRVASGGFTPLLFGERRLWVGLKARGFEFEAYKV